MAQKIELKGKSFLTLKDFTKEEIKYFLSLASYLKTKKKIGIKGDLLEGKNIALLFEKASTRTRCSFEVAAHDEGAQVTYLGPKDCHMGKKESMEDTAKVLGRFFDGIEFRGYKQETVECLSKYSGVPVWNGLTDEYHPTQILADFLTIEEHAHKPLSEIKLVFTGDTRNNMSYALMYGAAKMGMHFVALGPDSLKPDEDILKEMQEYSKETGATIEFSSNVDEAVKGADVIYTDIWVSMGEDESLYPERVKLLTPYKVTREMMNKTGNKNTLFMHCLPSFHDEDTEVCKDMMDRLGLDIREVEDEVFRSKNSVVFDEAENRMHTIKAVMVATAGR